MRTVQRKLQPHFHPQDPPRDQSMAVMFHEASKLDQYRMRELAERIAQIQTGGYVRRIVNSYKSYPGLPQVELPRANLVMQNSLQNVIVQRRTVRQFDPEQTVSQQELANILQLAYGITGSLDLGNGVSQYQRATPSAGGLYPMELYLVAERVQDIEPGIYHYRVATHGLEQLSAGSVAEHLQQNEQEWGLLSSAAFHLLICAVPERTTFKYHERGYRFVLMEAGILGQQVGTIASCQGIQWCMIGGFADDALTHLLGLDGINEFVLLPICFGR